MVMDSRIVLIRKPGSHRVFFSWLPFDSGLTTWRGSGPIYRWSGR